MNETSPNLTTSIAGGVTRAVAAGAGTATAVSAHDEILQMVGALVTALSIAWSVWEKISAARRGARELSAVSSQPSAKRVSPPPGEN